MKDIAVTSEMIHAAIDWMNEKHDGETIQMAQLVAEAYVVMETVRRRQEALDRELVIAQAVASNMGHA